MALLVTHGRVTAPHPHHGGRFDGEFLFGCGSWFAFALLCGLVPVTQWIASAPGLSLAAEVVGLAAAFVIGLVTILVWAQWPRTLLRRIPDPSTLSKLAQGSDAPRVAVERSA